MDDKAAQKGRDEALLLLVESLAATLDEAAFARFRDIAMAGRLEREQAYLDAMARGDKSAISEGEAFNAELSLFIKRVKLAWM